MRQQYQKKPRKKGREDLLASTVYTKVRGSGNGLYRKLMINDGDASTYSNGLRIGPGPANPNGLFGMGPRESSQTITKQQFNAERSEVKKRGNAERAKREGFRSVTEMQQSDQRKLQERLKRERLEEEREKRLRDNTLRRAQEEQQRRRSQPGYFYDPIGEIYGGR